MSLTPSIQCRNEACRQLAERVQRGAAYESLDVNVNIDQVLSNRQSDVPFQVQQAIEENCNFVLYADEKRYIIIIPCKLAVACYVDGVQGTLEQMKNMQQFRNRVKLAFVVYDKFYRIDRSIESGRNGNEPIPIYTTGEDLPDREEGAQPSEASLPG